MLSIRPIRPVALLASVLALGACSDTTGPSDAEAPARAARTGRLGLAFTTSPTSSLSGLLAEELVIGGDTLLIDKAQIVLREIELELAAGSCRDDDGDDDRDGDDDSDDLRANRLDGDDDDGDCGDLELGPVLVSLPLNGTTTQTVAIPAVPGTYKEVEFELHKPEVGDDDDDDDRRDREFLQRNPQWVGTSVRVEGSFNGRPFVFTSNVSASQELALQPPLTIGQGGQAELTLVVDVRSWFLNGSRSGLIDPATANRGGPNRDRVAENIKRSFGTDRDDD
jgi:hypothetical protein